MELVTVTANRFAYELADYQSLPEGAWAWRVGADDTPTDGVDTYNTSNSATFNVSNVAPDVLQVINYPNPFSSNTTIRYKLTKSARQVSVKIYNSAGRIVRTLTGSALRRAERRIESRSWKHVIERPMLNTHGPMSRTR